MKSASCTALNIISKNRDDFTGHVLGGTNESSSKIQGHNLKLHYIVSLHNRQGPSLWFTATSSRTKSHFEHNITYFSPQ